MSIGTKAVVKSLTMADSCLLSLPALVSSKNTLSCRSAAFKPFILHLSHCSHHPSILLPSLSLGRKTRPSSLITFIAQTSDWAQREEETEGEGYTDEEEGGQGGIFDDYEDGELDELIEGGSEDADQVELADDGDGEPSDDGDGEPSEEAKLFVGNLPYDVDGYQLAELFKEAGTVEVAEVIYNRETDRSRGFGFVTMSTIEEAEKAVEKFHRYDLGGRLLNVNKASPAGAKQERAWREPSFRVYVGNLPWDVDNVRLEQVFSEHGKVVSAKVIYDRETGRSRGFGFVDIASESEMNDAISALDGQSLDGRVIRVSVAEQRPRRANSF